MLSSILLLAKFLSIYGLLFYLVPRFVIKWEHDHTWLDKFFISLIHSHALIIVGVHALVVVNLYETISLLFFIFVTYVIYLRIKNKKWLYVSLLNIVLSLLQFAEKRDTWKDWKNGILISIKAYMKNRTEILKSKISKHPFLLLIIVLLFAVSIMIRFHHSITHLYFGSSDPYVHLKWAKLLRSNEIYVDGVYPYGFEAIISSFQVLFNIDPYVVLRYIGPLSGCLIVLGIYYIMRKIFPNNYLYAILAVLVYFISSYQFGYIWRQISSLSMEYGVVFILPAIHYFLIYMKDKRVTSLIISLECFLITIFVHPYASICLFLGYTIMLLIYYWKLRFAKFMKLIGLFFITGVLGITPLIIGLLSGVPFHSSSIGFVMDSLQTNVPSFNEFTLNLLLNQNEHILIFICCLIAASIFLIFYRKTNQELHRTDLVPYFLISVLLLFFYKSEELGLPSIMMAYRIEVFLPIFTSIVIGLSLIIFHKLPANRMLQFLFIVGLSIFFIYNIDQFQLPKGDRYQYDEAVEAYLKIKNDMPLQNWTIVSPIEEYSLSIGYGWHYNLSDFITDIATGEEIKFPTKDVFIFIENIPINSGKPIQTSETTNLTLPKVEDPLDHYTNPEYRRLLEEKALYWIESVQNQRENFFTIFLQTKNMTIYRIEQDPLKPIDLSTLLR